MDQPATDDSKILALNHAVEARFDSPADQDMESSSPEVRELVSTAHAHHKNGEPGLVIESLLEALDLEPDNRHVRTILAITLALEGYIDASEDQFIEALGVAEAHYNLGVILFELGEIQEAEQRFLIAVQNKPTLTDAHLWLNTTRAELAAQTALLHMAIHPHALPPHWSDVRQADTSPPATDNTSVIQAGADIHGIQLRTGADWRPQITSTKGPTPVVLEAPQQQTEIVSAPTFPDASRNELAPTESRPQEVPLPTPRTAAPLTDAERTELARLRADIEQLRLERDILKKAIGVIAGDDL
jgi:tetratricopeptide (TPR) repeat protein